MDFSALTPILTSQTALLAAIGVGTMIAVVGVGRALTEKGPAAIRMSPKNRISATGPNRAVRDDDRNYGTLASALLPESAEERFAITIALSKAGFRGKNAVTGYYMLRLVLALGLPVLLLLAITFARMPDAPGWLASTMGSFTTIGIAQLVCILCGAGFFGPSLWLRGKIAERRQAISEAFPNALDLIQIGVEAGLGFDQALMRVAAEIRSVAPDLADEILLAQNEIQAGRDRDKALMHMARRTGVDEVAAFVNVVLQSARFGTPMSAALTTYAEEMRLTRELKAQEKANKLPVQMSGVMASLMLPAILMLTLGPVVIRYIDYFANNPAGG
jgi:tight adherence protein C